MADKELEKVKRELERLELNFGKLAERLSDPPKIQKGWVERVGPSILSAVSIAIALILIAPISEHTRYIASIESTVQDIKNNVDLLLKKELKAFGSCSLAL